MEDNQLIEAAFQTFSLVPEIYAEILEENSEVQFPDEMIDIIKADPSKAKEVLADNVIAEAVVKTFANNQEEIMQAAQEKASQQQMFKAGGKLEQGLQMFQAGGLTRRQAIDKAMRVHGYQKRSDARRAYRNAKEGLRREANLRGRELRGEAREFITRRGPDDDIIIPEREVVIDTSIPTAKKWNEAVVTVGDLVAPETATVTKTIRIKPTPAPTPAPTPRPRPNPDPIPEGGIDDTKKQQLMSDAWYEYQAGRAGYDQLNHNYSPWAGPYEAAYQHWMWDDFKNAWDYDHAKVKSHFFMHSPTKEELMPYLNAGRFTHGVLPSFASRNRTWSEYGVDPTLKNNRFYTGRREYRADAAARPLPNNPADVELLNNVGSMILLPFYTMDGAANAAYKGAQAARKALPAAKEVLTIDAAKTPLMIGQGTNNALIPISAVFRRGGVIKAQEGTGLMNRNPFEMQAIKPSGSKIGSYFANRMMANRAKESLNNSMENAQNESINRLRPLDPTMANFKNIRPNAQGSLPRVGFSIDEPPVTSKFENTPNIVNINKSSINTPNSLPIGGQSYNEPANMPTLPQGFSVPENIKRLKMKGNKIKMSFKQSGGLLKLDLAANNKNF